MRSLQSMFLERIILQQEMNLILKLKNQSTL